MVDIDALKRRFESLLPTVDERMRRLIAAAESLPIDYGGISIVSRATGVSRRAIARMERSRFRRNDERRPGGHNWVGIADCHTENGLISYRLKEKAKLRATAGRSVYDQ